MDLMDHRWEEDKKTKKGYPGIPLSSSIFLNEDL